MLLAIDLGNTNLAFGLFEGDALRHDWRLATRRDSMPDELGLLMVQLIRQDGFDPKSVDGVVVASVVPPLNSALVQAIERYFDREPLVVGPGVKTGLKIHYRNPKEVGAQPRVIATGGFAGLIAAQTPVIELVDQRLMLEGLRLIYDMNV